eukprot:CAMPEP_0183304502 /NCGR_PEP_ID=MMETSP0160_2-20130417/9570_1 /TAXON_ID=2839 ORGANISM="Odontella Sinensis, Strain Grunow 1884" /NCGR_SAMPLE_ID=MMETSP0160_2 /ASSEMBLY_ACC=CAM_ASM_000250 /LENGTH=119 /DNA_ID=CAMNT_0025467563 /DNA_START=231 /DNA_END=590 /DNA_ORIENTATION=+
MMKAQQILCSKTRCGIKEVETKNRHQEDSEPRADLTESKMGVEGNDCGKKRATTFLALPSLENGKPLLNRELRYGEEDGVGGKNQDDLSQRQHHEESCSGNLKFLAQIKIPESVLDDDS